MLYIIILLLSFENIYINNGNSYLNCTFYNNVIMMQNALKSEFKKVPKQVKNLITQQR